MTRHKVSQGITAFIDVLGFGERVLATRSLEDIDNIARRLKMIQSEFDFETKDPDAQKDNASMRRTILAFSDSILVNLPFSSDRTGYPSTFSQVVAELVSFSYGQGRCACNGIFLRGGVDIGWWYRSRHTLISQSLAGAYKAENKANVPVIALTSELSEYLLTHADRGNLGVDHEDEFGRSMRLYEAEDSGKTNRFWYIDYITLCVEYVIWPASREQAVAYESAPSDQSEAVSERGYFENRCAWFERHARSVESACAATPNERVKEKYRWLATYHNEIASRYSATANCRCNIGP